MRPRRLALAVLLAAGVAAASPRHARAQSGAVDETAPARNRKVLALYFASREAQGFASVDVALHSALREELSNHLDYYSEYIDLIRFPDPTYRSAFLTYLRARYSMDPPDVVIASSASVVEFLNAEGTLFGRAPIVFAARPGVSAGAHSTGIVSSVDFKSTLTAALAARPDTKQIFVISGASAFDRLYLGLLKEQSKGLAGVALVDLVGLPLVALEERVRNLPPNSVVFFVSASEDGAGRTLMVVDVLNAVTAASNAPVYSWHEAFLGHGIVGGRLHSTVNDAKAIARLAVRVAHGEPPEAIPVTVQDSNRFQFDWRELQRWGIRESVLPSGSAILFRSPSFFELYRWYVLGGLMIVGGELALIVGLLVQHGRRRRAEETSRNSEQRYRSVVETQTELICRFLPDSTLTFVNDAYCRFWSATRDELVGRKFLELIPSQARDGVRERIERLKAGVDSHEHMVTLPDGTIGWQHWINHAIVDERGRLIELQGVGRDITDRKRAEEAVGRLEARNSAMLRAVPDLMFVIMRDGTYVDYHARDPGLLFLPPATFLGKTIGDVMPAHLTAIFMDAIERAMQTDDPIVVEYDLPMSETKYFEARIVRAGSDRVLSMVRDVSEAKRAVALNRDLAGRLIVSQEAERQRIARELHDDLSQKIALLKVDIDQIARQSQSDDDRSRLENVSRQALEIAGGVHHLSHDLHPSKLQTLGLVSAMQSLCRDAGKVGVSVEFHHDDHFPTEIDPGLSLCLYRILQESLNNIVKHSQASDAWVRLSSEHGDVCLYIADSGIGFDVRNVQAEGLGLVSMRERVAHLKGHLVIRTSPGSGTRIGVRIPVSDAQAAQPSDVKSA